MSLYGNSIYGNSILLVESDSGGGSGGSIDHIESSDLSNNVTCHNGGYTTWSTGGSERIRFDAAGRLLLTNGGATTSFGTALEIQRNGQALLDIVSFGGLPNLLFRRANGVYGAPTATVINDTIAIIAGSGYDSTGFTSNRGVIIMGATENWTPVANGTRMTFHTTPNGSAVNAQRMIVDQNGFVGIGTGVPTSQLHVSGAAGTTLRIADTQQATGRILRCVDALGNVKWEQPTSLVFAHASLYHEDGIGVATAVTGMVALNTKYLVDVPTTLGDSSSFTMPANGTLKYTGTDTHSFHISIGLSIRNDDDILSSDIREIYFWIYKNGVLVPGTSNRTFTIPGVIFTEAYVETYLSLVTNDEITLYVSNESAVITTTAGISVGTMQIIID